MTKELIGIVLTLLILEFGLGAVNVEDLRATKRLVLTLLILEFGLGV